MRTVQHQFAFLVVDGGAHHDDSRRALGNQFGDLQCGIERVAGIDGVEEFGVDLDEANQAFADDMGKQARARRGEGQYLKTVGERSAIAQRFAIFDVVMDRVVVEADGLEGGEIAVAQGARRIAKISPMRNS